MIWSPHELDKVTVSTVRVLVLCGTKHAPDVTTRRLPTSMVRRCGAECCAVCFVSGLLLMAAAGAALVLRGQTLSTQGFVEANCTVVAHKLEEVEGLNLKADCVHAVAVVRFQCRVEGQGTTLTQCEGEYRASDWIRQCYDCWDPMCDAADATSDPHKYARDATEETLGTRAPIGATLACWSTLATAGAAGPAINVSLSLAGINGTQNLAGIHQLGDIYIRDTPFPRPAEHLIDQVKRADVAIVAAVAALGFVCASYSSVRCARDAGHCGGERAKYDWTGPETARERRLNQPDFELRVRTA